MADIAPTTDRNTASGLLLVTWDPLAGTDHGVPITIGYSADITFQVFGTFDSATVTLQGSNNGVNWHALTQRGGTTGMAYTTAACHSPNEMPAFVRPHVAAGGPSTDVTVIMAIAAKYGKTGY